MAKHKQPCLICGRLFDYYDAAPRGFCSVGCEADAGEPLADLYARHERRAVAVEAEDPRGRPARTLRSVAGGVAEG